MKAILKKPKTRKQWFSFLLIIFTIILGIWPVIPLLNNETLIFGLPILMFWSILIIFLTTFVMWFINKIGGEES